MFVTRNIYKGSVTHLHDTHSKGHRSFVEVVTCVEFVTRLHISLKWVTIEAPPVPSTLLTCLTCPTSCLHTYTLTHFPHTRCTLTRIAIRTHTRCEYTHIHISHTRTHTLFAYTHFCIHTACAHSRATRLDIQFSASPTDANLHVFGSQ